MSYNAFDAEQRMADWSNTVRQLSIEELASDVQAYYTEYHTRWKPIIRQVPQMIGFTELQYRHFETIKALIDKAETTNETVKSLIDKAATINPTDEFREGYRGGMRYGLIFGGIAASIGWYVIRHFF